jgi:antitoxin ChpS
MFEVRHVYTSSEKGRWIHHAGGALPAVLKTLELSTDSEVGSTIVNGCLIIEPQKRPHYSLEELLAQCDPHAEMSEEDREWIDAPAVGKEIL